MDGEDQKTKILLPCDAALDNSRLSPAPGAGGDRLQQTHMDKLTVIRIWKSQGSAHK